MERGALPPWTAELPACPQGWKAPEQRVQRVQRAPWLCCRVQRALRGRWRQVRGYLTSSLPRERGSRARSHKTVCLPRQRRTGRAGLTLYWGAVALARTRKEEMGWMAQSMPPHVLGALPEPASPGQSGPACWGGCPGSGQPMLSRGNVSRVTSLEGRERSPFLGPLHTSTPRPRARETKPELLRETTRHLPAPPRWGLPRNTLGGVQASGPPDRPATEPKCKPFLWFYGQSVRPQATVFTNNSGRLGGLSSVSAFTGAVQPAGQGPGVALRLCRLSAAGLLRVQDREINSMYLTESSRRLNEI